MTTQTYPQKSLSDGGVHPLVHHEHHNTPLIQTPPSCPATHLNVLPRGDLGGGGEQEQEEGGRGTMRQRKEGRRKKEGEEREREEEGRELWGGGRGE